MLSFGELKSSSVGGDVQFFAGKSISINKSGVLEINSFFIHADPRDDSPHSSMFSIENS
jgi:hypothetical protein